MSTSPSPSHNDKIPSLLTQHTTVPPPYFTFPHTHPYSIHWRMGAGEEYMTLFSTWWEQHKESPDESARIEYFRKWPPPPRWLAWMIGVIWDVEIEDEDEDEGGDGLRAYFGRIEGLGFGGWEEYRRDLEDWDENEMS